MTAKELILELLDYSAMDANDIDKMEILIDELCDDDINHDVIMQTFIKDNEIVSYKTGIEEKFYCGCYKFIITNKS